MVKKMLICFLCFMLFLSMPGCKKKLPTGPDIPDLVLPSIEYFNANPESINRGESFTLSWYTTNATAVTIDQDIGTVSTYGTMDVSPEQTTTYILTAKNNDGQKTESCIIEVLQYDIYTIHLGIGVASTLGPAYEFNVYGGANDALLKVLTIPVGSLGTGTVNVSADFEMLKISSEETFSIKWKLISCSFGSSWASGANYQYWMTVAPTSDEIIVDPATQQRVGPFNGWEIGETKELTFKIKRI